MKTFVIVTEFGEILDLALQLKKEGNKVLFCITDKESKRIGDGLIDKIDDWHECIGEGYIFVFDGCNAGKQQDYLRGLGEAVFGGSQESDDLENDRQLGQKLFIKAGFPQSPSKNFKNIDEAIKFVKENKKRWILKQNGDAPKGLNHMQRLDSGEDMMYHLEELKKNWSDAEYGKFDCDLMEVVEGTEMACSAFWNGHDWMRNKDGKVVGFLNFEEKKEIDNGLGETTGEMGTTFYGCTEDNEYFADIMLRPEIEQYLKKTGFRGVFDINGCQTKEGYVAFEPTCRFGVPATSYEFITGLKSKTGDLIAAVAQGEDKAISIYEGVGMVMVVAGKPYPVEDDIADKGTSIEEKLWITGKLPDNVHLYNFYKDDEGDLKVATKCGYLFTVTSRGNSVEDAREKIINFLKDETVFLSGEKYRSDIGKRIEDFVEEL